VISIDSNKKIIHIQHQEVSLAMFLSVSNVVGNVGFKRKIHLKHISHLGTVLALSVQNVEEGLTANTALKRPDCSTEGLLLKKSISCDTERGDKVE